MTSRYSVSIIFPPSDDTYNEICQGKEIFVTEISGNCQGISSSDLGDTLIYYLLQYNTYHLQSTDIFSLFSRIATFYAFLVQFSCKNMVFLTFIARVKGVVFQKISWGSTPQSSFLSDCSQYPLSFQAALAASPIPVGKMSVPTPQWVSLRDGPG